MTEAKAEATIRLMEKESQRSYYASNLPRGVSRIAVDAVRGWQGARGSNMIVEYAGAGWSYRIEAHEFTREQFLAIYMTYEATAWSQKAA
jgi:hypothetical protein